MSDSPKSENFPSRFSTPVDELDDHRLQPESLPRTEPVFGRGSGPRASRRSTNGENRAFLAARDAFRQGLNARDLDVAVTDDDEDDEERNQESNRTGQEQVELQLSPGNASVTFKHPPKPEGLSQLPPRISLESAHSASTPNSVEAFAEPRQRGRAGTAESYAPSFMSVRRSISGHGHRERVRHLSVDRSAHGDNDDGTSEGSVEDDVCFPVQDESNTPYKIDYDDLEDFAHVHQHTVNIPFPFGLEQHSANNEDHKHRIFLDLSGRGAKDKRAEKASHRSSTDSGSSSSSSSKEKKLDEENFGRGKRQPETINRWSFFSSELEDMIHAPELCGLLMPGESFRHLFELGPDGGVWWLDMLMPTEDEIEAVCKAFGVHGLTREDIIQQETREKVELFKSYYFVCFRSFYQMDKHSEHYLEPVNVYAVVFREGILTFTFCPSPHAANVRKRMSKLRDYVSLGADWIAYALIDDIVDTFGPVIGEVEQESEAIEDNVFTARPEDLRAILQKIGHTRKTVMSLLRLLGGKADVIKGFAKRCNEQYSSAPRQDVGMYLSDIQDHVVTMMSNLAHFEKMLSRSHANYLAQIQMDNIVQGNRVNATLGKVTFMATILVPLNLVTGLFGMNVNVPGAGDEGLKWWFGILSFIIGFVLVAFAIAKRLRFI